MKSESELLFFYNSTLLPILEPLEKYRLDQLEKVKRNLFLSLPFILVVLIGIWIKSKVTVILFFLGFIYFFGSSAYELIEMIGYLRKHFKFKVLNEIMTFLFDEYEYIPNQKIAKSVLDKSMLFSSSTAYVYGEDFMRFKIGETHIMFCETTTYNIKNKILFDGLFISAAFNKSFTSKTFLVHRSLGAYFSATLKFLFKDIEVVKLEDKIFTNEFHTLSTDQVESRYILTPSLMQRILDYKKKSGKNLSFSFVENRLYCAIPKYSDHFEPALFKPYNYEFIKYTIAPLILYTDIVEDLNLNLRIWTKIDE